MPIFSFNSLTKLLDLEFTNSRVLLITFVMCCNLPYTRSGENSIKTLYTVCTDIQQLQNGIILKRLNGILIFIFISITNLILHGILL